MVPAPPTTGLSTTCPMPVSRTSPPRPQPHGPRRSGRLRAEPGEAGRSTLDVAPLHPQACALRSLRVHWSHAARDHLRRFPLRRHVPNAYQTSKWIATSARRTASRSTGGSSRSRRSTGSRARSIRGTRMELRLVDASDRCTARRTSMDDLDAWYERAGRALHEDGHRPHQPDVARHLLQEIGLDPALVDQAIADETTHDDVRTEHQK